MSALANLNRELSKLVDGSAPNISQMQTLSSPTEVHQAQSPDYVSDASAPRPETISASVAKSHEPKVPKLSTTTKIKKRSNKMGRPLTPASEYFTTRFKKLIQLHELSKNEKLSS